LALAILAELLTAALKKRQTDPPLAPERKSPSPLYITEIDLFIVQFS